MYYINTLKRELVDNNAYKLQPSLSERVIIDGHGCHTALHFGVMAKENQNKVPTLYWLPKLHKKPYKARFIANSSSCTTTELSKLLTSCLTAVKKHVIKYFEKSFLVWASFCLTGQVGDDVSFGKLKLMSDSGLVVSLSGENEFDSSKIVVSNKVLMTGFALHT